MAVNVTYYLCKIGQIIPPNSGAVLQNDGSYAGISNDPKIFSSKDSAITYMENLTNGEYYLVERYFKS